MKLNKKIIKEILEYLIKNQGFDFNKGMIEPIELVELTNILTNKTQDDKIREEYYYTIALCINEGLVETNYPDIMWGKASVTGVTFKGYEWVENN